MSTRGRVGRGTETSQLVRALNRLVADSGIGCGRCQRCSLPSKSLLDPLAHPQAGGVAGVAGRASVGGQALRLPTNRVLQERIGHLLTRPVGRRASPEPCAAVPRVTAEQCINEGKGAVKWTRLSYRTFAANAVQLQLHALAYNLGNFLWTQATPEPIKHWSLTSLKEKQIKIGAKLVSHGRYVGFQMAEVAVSRHLFAEILRLIGELRPPPDPAPA